MVAMRVDQSVEFKARDEATLILLNFSLLSHRTGVMT